MKTTIITAAMLSMALSSLTIADDATADKQVKKEMDVRVEVVKEGDKSVKKVWINDKAVDLNDPNALKMLSENEQVLILEAGHNNAHECKHHEGKEGDHKCEHHGEGHQMKKHKMIKIKAEGKDGQFKAIKHLLSSAELSDEQKNELRELLK